MNLSGLVRKFLDGLYLLSGVLASVFLVIILGLIVIQMLARWTGEVFPGAPDYAGYAMAAASFLAFANALNHGSHIRVSIVLNAVSHSVRKWIEIWCFGLGTIVAWWMTYYIWRMIGFAIEFHDVSQGQDATPLWIPQMPMLIGAVILGIALTDNLVSLLMTGEHRMQRNIDEQSHGE